MPLLIVVTASVVSFLMTAFVIVIYRKFGIVETPDPNKPMTTHDTPVPRGGGIPIFISILLSLILFIPMDQHLLGVLLGALILTIVGVLDDIYNLNPYLRLFLLFASASVVVASGIGIPFINIPFVGITPLNNPSISFWFLGEQRSIWVLADLFALFWIVGIMNFVNWSKGLDGQLPGIVVISSLTVGLLSLRFSADITQWSVLLLALAVAGAYAGFLPWNFYPQRIMPGFGGGILGGYFLAVMSILSTAKVGTLLVVLGVPLVDALFTIVRRILRKKSPVWGDREHLHHRLLDQLGWSKRTVALFYWGVTAGLGVVALQLNSQQKFYTMLSIVLGLGGALLWLRHFGRSSKLQGRSDG